MAFWRSEREAEEEDDPPFDLGLWSARLAWLVLAAVALLFVLRLTVATVVKVHGHGMAPSLGDGDSVLMLRGTWSVSRGDVVVYEPVGSDTPGPSADAWAADEVAQLPPESNLPNAAVFDAEALGERWRTLERRAIAAAQDDEMAFEGEFRVGRVLAVPGDVVTFNVQGAALGLSINGELITQKRRSSVHLHGHLPDRNEQSWVDERGRKIEASSALYEWLAERRYPVLASTTPVEWSGMHLPDRHAPVEMEAAGYLIIADNRDGGACCDGRRLGWIAAGRIRGEIVRRLASRSPGARAEAS